MAANFLFLEGRAGACPSIDRKKLRQSGLRHNVCSQFMASTSSPVQAPPRAFHFMGICGSAMGAVAAMLRDQGYTVTGSDEGSPLGEALGDVLEPLGLRPAIRDEVILLTRP